MTTPEEDLQHARQEFFRAARALAIGNGTLRERVKVAYSYIVHLSSMAEGGLPTDVAEVLKGHSIEIGLQEGPDSKLNKWIDVKSDEGVDKLADQIIRMAFEVERALTRQEAQQ